MVTTSQLLELLRSISFGALSVCFTLYLIFTYHPTVFPSHTTPREIVFLGLAAGTLVHRLLHSILFNPLTKSVARSFAFYSSVLELSLNFQAGLLTSAEYQMFGEQLKSEYFGKPKHVISRQPTVSTDQLRESEQQQIGPGAAEIDGTTIPKKLKKKKSRNKPSDATTVADDNDYSDI